MMRAKLVEPDQVALEHMRLTFAPTNIQSGPLFTAQAG
jgi:hypothetical protein